jgi:catechol 2,3-dioxygenase-like lactoylglutathione lyase family enzyme
VSSHLQFINPVVFVKDIEVSKKFYRDVLKLEIVQDSGPFVLFENHFSLHQASEILLNACGEDSSQMKENLGSDNLLLYFESADLEETFAEIQSKVELIHPILQQAWGQRVFRFYDPDRHIIEIGEPMV